jgi:hypothetical protein
MSIIGRESEVALSMKCKIIIIIEKVIAISIFFFFLASVAYFFVYIGLSSFKSEFNEVLNAGVSSIFY